MTFPILDVSAWPTVREEPMGGKPKEWRADPGGRLWLFKEVNRRTPAGSGSADELLGEDWAEKIASELVS